MDGVYFTELSLDDSDASGLVVTGGRCGRFMCEYMSAYRNLLLVSTETGQGKELEMLRGGDLFPDNWVTDKGKVESALTYFLENVALAPEFRWQ